MVIASRRANNFPVNSTTSSDVAIPSASADDCKANERTRISAIVKRSGSGVVSLDDEEFEEELVSDVELVSEVVSCEELLSLEASEDTLPVLSLGFGGVHEEKSNAERIRSSLIDVDFIICTS
ncbi:hypothetical protein EOM60_05405 [Candidatus Saccharibacteria bacterium]|nr:hypothetical protein [Candidatus Saccharibacteria bacterium]